MKWLLEAQPKRSPVVSSILGKKGASRRILHMRYATEISAMSSFCEVGGPVDLSPLCHIS